MITILKIAQLVISISLIVSILLQNRGASVSGLFGGSGSVYRTKRGIEKSLFITTIILSVLFLLISLVIVVL